MHDPLQQNSSTLQIRPQAPQLKGLKPPKSKQTPGGQHVAFFANGMRPLQNNGGCPQKWNVSGVSLRLVPDKVSSDAVMSTTPAWPTSMKRNVNVALITNFTFAMAMSISQAPRFGASILEVAVGVVPGSDRSACTDQISLEEVEPKSNRYKLSKGCWLGYLEIGKR